MRTFDDPATWTELHLAADGLGGETYRTSRLDNQRELCDLTADPIEADNRWTDPGLHELRQHLRMQLKEAHATSVPDRNQPWPYAVRQATDRGAHPMRSAAMRFVRRLSG